MESKEKKQKKPDAKEARINELTETLQRLQAEFENYKKRVEKENTEFRKYAECRLIGDILPALDSFELALKSDKNKEEFVKGIELIYAQLFSLLESKGLRPMKALGEKFDPYKHEALLTENKDDTEEDTIIEELQKGYMFKDTVLRSAKVKIAKGGKK